MNNPDTQAQLNTLLEQLNRAHEKLHAWLRWLVLLAAGFFSLMAGQLAGRALALPALWALKAALVCTALGILAGAVALFGEVVHARCLFDAQKAQVLAALDGLPQTTALSTTARRPQWARLSEQACYGALLASVLGWLVFVVLL